MTRYSARFFGGGILAFAILLWVMPAWAEVSIVAAISDTHATTEDQLKFTLTVSGLRDTVRPDLSGLAQFFDIVNAGTSQNMQIVNGDVSVSSVSTFYLTPLREGSFTIPAFTLNYQGKSYSSEPISITVTKPSQTGQDQSGIEARQPNMKLELSNEHPFPGEQVLLTLRVTSPYEFTSYNWIGKPNLDDFISEPVSTRTDNFGRTVEFDIEQKVKNGRALYVAEYQVALYPLKPGLVTLGPIIMEWQYKSTERRGRGNSPFDDPFFNDPFFGSGRSETKRLRIETFSINVRDYPPGKPENFCGIAGKLEMQANLSSPSTKIGESTTLTIEFNSNGYLKGLELPNIIKDDRFKIYDDKPVYTSRMAGKEVIGNKIFKKALAPIQDGVLDIPPLKLSYLDPASGSYKTVESTPFQLKVEKGEQQDNLNLVQQVMVGKKKEAVKLVGKDILQIHTAYADMADERLTGFRKMVYAGLLFGPIGLYLLAAHFILKRQRFRSDERYAKFILAHDQVKGQLARLKKSSGKSSSEMVTDLARLLREFLGHKLGTVGEAQTPEELAHKLIERGMAPEFAKKVKLLLEECEYVIFSAARRSDQEVQQMLGSVEEVIGNVESHMKRQRQKFF